MCLKMLMEPLEGIFLYIVYKVSGGRWFIRDIGKLYIKRERNEKGWQAKAHRPGNNGVFLNGWSFMRVKS